MGPVTIVGLGRVGSALLRAFERCGIHAGTVSRSTDVTAGIAGTTVIMCVPDDVIASTAARIVPHLEPASVVLHTSGALDSSVLEAASKAGHFVGSIHPLRSFAANDPGDMRGVNFCIEGDGIARDAADTIVELLGGNSFTIESSQKALYHASAVMAAGHVVAQFAMAVDMLAECGIGRDNARSLLFPLLAGTVENLSQMPEKQALTGPFARGDAGTVERDLKAVDSSGVELAGEIFRALGRKALELADLPAEKRCAVEKILGMESPAAK